jgi:hypothetical protein
MSEAEQPIEPAAYRKKPLLGLGFWIAIAFGVLCIAGGYALARLGPKYLPVPAPPAPQAQADLHALDARLADIQARLPATAPAASAQAPAAPAQIADLQARLTRLETGEQRTVQAAAAALAVSTLAQAAEGAAPFPAEMAAVERLLPPSADLRALRALAAAGAPTRAALASQFPDAAARAASASRSPIQGQGGFARLIRAATAFVSIRRVDQLTGGGADAVLARAERRADDGDLAGAQLELASLPQAGKDAMADWNGEAQRRAAIDKALAGLRAQALQSLTEARTS